MEKMSSDLHVEKKKHVGYEMYLKKKNYTILLSSHPHALQQRQFGLDDDHDQILINYQIWGGGHFLFLLNLEKKAYLL